MIVAPPRSDAPTRRRTREIHPTDSTFAGPVTGKVSSVLSVVVVLGGALVVVVVSATVVVVVSSGAVVVVTSVVVVVGATVVVVVVGGSVVVVVGVGVDSQSGSMASVIVIGSDVSSLTGL